jgi:hypothetical protein
VGSITPPLHFFIVDGSRLVEAIAERKENDRCVEPLYIHIAVVNVGGA